MSIQGVHLPRHAVNVLLGCGLQGGKLTELGLKCLGLCCILVVFALKRADSELKFFGTLEDFCVNRALKLQLPAEALELEIDVALVAGQLGLFAHERVLLVSQSFDLLP